MTTPDLSMLVARLNETCRKSLERAAGSSVTRTHYNVEVEHWILALIELPDTDALLLLKHFGVDTGGMAADLNRALDGMKTGNARAPSLSPDIVRVIKQAWLSTSINRDARIIRSADLIFAVLEDERVSTALRQAVPQVFRIDTRLDAATLDGILAGSAEQLWEPGRATQQGRASGEGEPQPTQGPSAALEAYTMDLTRRARDGAIDPITGRDVEIRQMIDILTRRRQNNPILVGEAGVGKTAVVEALALRIAAEDVPRSLATVSIHTLDIGLLQAGAGAKGEFESRLRAVTRAVAASPTPIVLFVDEAHMLMGAGDGANLLKPALARGELRMIAATTWAEYKKYFERDAALTRRFQSVIVAEPDQPTAIAMIRGLVATLEAHHDIPITDDAVSAAVRLSARYIPSRQLPDKAVSLLDTACARVAMTQANTPAALEDITRRLGLIETECRVLSREMALGMPHGIRLGALAAERDALLVREKALAARWGEERRLVETLRQSRTALLAEATMADVAMAGYPAEQAQVADAEGYTALWRELHTVQGEQPLVFPVVDAQAVAEVVADWTGIPVGRMRSNEIKTILELQSAMAQRIVGQDHSLQAIAQSLRTSRAGLTDPRKPVGVFLMVGPSGTGKTETALTLAELLFGNENALTVINMSEFKEEHKVSLLMGSPPGYVGYGEGGILTEAIRRRPYSVVLLDEMEKAHPGVQDVFYQVFDKGQMMDGEGRVVDFRNTIIMMTSNVGAELLERLHADPDTAPAVESFPDLLQGELLKVFRPAFLGRVQLLPYRPLNADRLREIVTLQIGRVQERFRSHYGGELIIEPSVVDALARRCSESSMGARAIDATLSDRLLPELSMRMLAHMSDGHPAGRVTVDLDRHGTFQYAVECAS